MAESDNGSTDQFLADEERLRYLKFVHATAAQMLVCAAALYAYAKDSAGPLKPGVETVEGTVKTVVGPVYDKYHGMPLHLLKFLDRKMQYLRDKILSGGHDESVLISIRAAKRWEADSALRHWSGATDPIKKLYKYADYTVDLIDIVPMSLARVNKRLAKLKEYQKQQSCNALKQVEILISMNYFQKSRLDAHASSDNWARNALGVVDANINMLIQCHTILQNVHDGMYY